MSFRWYRNVNRSMYVSNLTMLALSLVTKLYDIVLSFNTCTRFLTCPSHSPSLSLPLSVSLSLPSSPICVSIPMQYYKASTVTPTPTRTHTYIHYIHTYVHTVYYTSTCTCMCKPITFAVCKHAYLLYRLCEQ